jgi:hypothetical protein
MLSPTTRLAHPRTLRNKHLWRALVVESTHFERHDGYGVHYSPRLWAKVFSRVYLSHPVDDHDPRWNALLKTGFLLLRELCE